MKLLIPFNKYQLGKTLSTHIAIFFLAQSVVMAQQHTLFIGTYTKKEGHVNGKATGIYSTTFDAQKGSITVNHLSKGPINPTYLAVSSKHKTLYAVSELADAFANPFGHVNAYSIEEDGKLTFKNQQSSYGLAPCHLALSPNQKELVVSNYVSGSAYIYPLTEDGVLKVPTLLYQSEGHGTHRRQEAPHMHSAIFSENTWWLADLGTDKVFAIEYADKKWTEKISRTITLPEGAGPRHTQWNADKSRLFILGELDATLYWYDMTGKKPVLKGQVATLPEPFPNNTAAHLEVHPSGKWVYFSNRGYNHISVIQMKDDVGHVIQQMPCGGAAPRNFTIDPSGKWLIVACQDTDNLSIFSIHPTTGELKEHCIVNDILTPVCLTWE